MTKILVILFKFRVNVKLITRDERRTYVNYNNVAICVLCEAVARKYGGILEKRASSTESEAEERGKMKMNIAEHVVCKSRIITDA
jgi:hypothetical protein